MGSHRLARRLGVAGIAVTTLVATSFYAVLGATTGWPTYQHDAGRSGADPDALQTAAISAGWNTQLDGQLYAQPLVSSGVVYAATENNTVYALNADSGAILWQQHLATPARLNQLPCGNIDPYGITSTPAMDMSSGVLYTVALQSTPTIHHELYALNVSSGGAVLRHFPIDAPGADPLVHNQRAALSLANGKVYVPYAGRAGDCGNYVGRVVGVNTSDPTGASLVSYTLPNTTMGGIWAAASVDGSGALYVATGNSNATGTTPDRGESVVKLSPTLGELDFFTAPEWQNLNIADTDIGSIGPILLQNGWILQSGKNGKGYLLNSANLGRVGGQLFEGQICDQGQQATAWGAYLPPSTVFIPCSSALKAVHIQMSGTPGFTVTTVRGGYSGFPGASPPILAGGVLWNLDNGNRLLLGFDPTTGQNLFSQPLSGTPAHFAAPSSGAGHLFVPAGSILEAFSVSSGGAPTATPTPTLQSTSTPTVQPTSTIQPTSTPTAQPTSTPTQAAQATYISRAVGSPNPVAPGATFAMTSTVISSQASAALIDVEIYDPSFTRVFEQVWDNQSFAAGQPNTFNSSWQVPTTAPTGVYTIIIGVFSPGGGTLYNWNSSAGNVVVAPVSLPPAVRGAAPGFRRP